MDLLLNRTSFYQLFDLLPYASVSMFNQFPHNAVRTCICPIGRWQGIDIRCHHFYIIHDTPWIVYFCIAEQIAVIPLSDPVPLFR